MRKHTVLPAGVFCVCAGFSKRARPAETLSKSMCSLKKNHVFGKAREESEVVVPRSTSSTIPTDNAVQN
jgi:hypothetical protein